TEVSRAFPALKRTTFFALILMGSPVCGLRPVRAFLFEMPKVPKPTSVTLFPLRRDLSIPPTSASIALVADAFVIPASLATLSISSVLFIQSPPFDSRLVGDSLLARTFRAAREISRAWPSVNTRKRPNSRQPWPPVGKRPEIRIARDSPGGRDEGSA